LDNINGPYQVSDIFINAPKNTDLLYVRDINGCGIVKVELAKFIDPVGFPKFFTPNGDGIHDFWQYRSDEDDNFELITIYIRDRYGKLLIQLNPRSKGWNGIINGTLLPTSDYWYNAITLSGEIFTGHFTLKR